MVRNWASWRKRRVWVTSWRKKKISAHNFFFGRQVHADAELNQRAMDSKHGEQKAPSSHWAKLKGAASVMTRMMQNSERRGTSQRNVSPAPTDEDELADNSPKLSLPIITVHVHESRSSIISIHEPPVLQSVSSIDISAEEL